ncbi:unnamed protein product, partial [Strongylus vulgaris]
MKSHLDSAAFQVPYLGFKALVEELREGKCLADARVEELEEQEGELLGKVFKIKGLSETKERISEAMDSLT